MPKNTATNGKIVSLTSMGAFQGLGVAYSIVCANGVTETCTPPPYSFRVSGRCDAVWVRAGLESQPIEIPILGPFQMCLHLADNNGDQPLPPIVIKGNKANATKTPGPQKHEPGIASKYLYVIVHFQAGMDINSLTPMPPFTKDLVISSDLNLYNGYKIVAFSAICNDVIDYEPLSSGFEINFVLTDE